MEITNFKNITMNISLEELINKFDLSATIKSLHQNSKSKEKLAQAKENRQKSALRKVDLRAKRGS